MEDRLNKLIDNTEEERAPNRTFFPSSLCFHWSQSGWERAVSQRRLPPLLPQAHLGEPCGMPWEGDRLEGKARGSVSDAGLLQCRDGS